MSGNENRETIADIVAKMRKYRDLVIVQNNFADRIESAWKREKSEIEADALNVGAVVATTEESSAVGNAAAMRAALSESCYAMFNFLKTQSGGYEEMAIALDKAKAALSEPPRNCDVGTADEQAQRYDKFCEGTDCVKCPVHALWHHYFEICKNGKVSCGLMWAQMPYEADAKKEERSDAE